MKRTSLMLAAALALLAAACEKPTSPGAVDGGRLAASDTNGEWLAAGRTYGEQRYSPLDKINTETVGRLGLAWYADVDTDRGQEATPVVVDGVIYGSTAWSKVFARDAATGALKWTYDPKVDGAKGFDACCDVVNRGVAVWKGRVYLGALDGRLIALDARTGDEVWSVQTTDKAKPYTITGAPRVVKDKVLIGNGGAEYGVRGYISAYDAATGKLVWRFYTTPNPEGKADGAASDKVLAQKAAATWSDGLWKQTGGGGTVWDGMAYDPALDIAYFGVGNGSPWNHKLRSGGKGDNLFVSSILALKPDTGEYVWHYQTTPGETWDFTATQPIMLADLTIAGKPRKVLMQAPKNGFFYVIDRADGRLISAKPFVQVTWATAIDPATGRPVENPAARYPKGAVQVLPSALGAHNWNPMAFSPKTGLVYLPAQSVPYTYGDDKGFTYRPGALNLGVDSQAVADKAGALPPEQARPRGVLIAWDPVAQAARWSVPHQWTVNAGTMATAGGLVFQGVSEGEFNAYDAATGKKLWSYKTGNGVIAAPMTFEIKDEQYVALLVGNGGAVAAGGGLTAPWPRLPGRLMVFKLGGTVKAPEHKAAEMPPVDLTGVTSAGDVKNGAAVYNRNCFMCHGAQVSGSWHPDLKRSQMLRAEEDWRSVVIDGARSSRGMASFARFLTPADAEDVRAYVLSVARQPPPTTQKVGF